MPQSSALHNYYNQYFGSNIPPSSASASSSARDGLMDYFKRRQTIATMQNSREREGQDEDYHPYDIPTFNLIESDDNDESDNVEAILPSKILVNDSQNTKEFRETTKQNSENNFKLIENSQDMPKSSNVLTSQQHVD